MRGHHGSWASVPATGVPLREDPPTHIAAISRFVSVPTTLGSTHDRARIPAIVNKLHYKGDCRDFVPNRIVGPDVWGAWYLPVSVHYFDGITTIFYKSVPPDQLPPQAAMLSKQVVAQQQPLTGGPLWARGTVPSPLRRSPDSSVASPTSPGRTVRRQQEARAAKGLTKSQRELLKRFRKQG